MLRWKRSLRKKQVCANVNKSKWCRCFRFVLSLLYHIYIVFSLDAATVRKIAAHPSTAIMVKEALKELDSRKGVSSQAIQSYIKQKYPSVDLVRLKHFVRRALKKGIENGTLVRPANSGVATGAMGKFRVRRQIYSFMKTGSDNVINRVNWFSVPSLHQKSRSRSQKTRTWIQTHKKLLNLLKKVPRSPKKRVWIKWGQSEVYACLKIQF